VAPFSWSVPGAVNQHIADLARELRVRGHRPVIVVSSDASADSPRIRALFHRTRGQVVTLLHDYRRGGEPDRLLLPPAGTGPLAPEEGIPVVPLGSSFPVRLNGGVANLGLPVDVTSRMEKLMLGAGFDLVHVHEPLAPSLSFTALRETRSPVVGTFHLTPVGVAAYELGQAVLDRFLLRLDARIVTFPSGREILEDLYPGHYEVVPCGTSLAPSGPRAGARPGAFTNAGTGGRGAAPASSEPFGLYVYRGDGRRSYRALLRALLASFPVELDHMVVALHRASVERWVPRTVPRALRSQIRLREFDSPAELAGLYREAAVTVLPFLGGEWLSVTAAEAAVCGCPVAGPDLPPVHDVLSAGVTGVVFSPTRSGSLLEAIGAMMTRGEAAAAEAAPEPEATKVPLSGFALETAATAPPAPGAAPGPAAPEGSVPFAAAPPSSAYAMTAVAGQLEQIYQDTIAATSGRHGLTVKTPVAGHSLHVRGIGEVSARRRMRHAASAVRPDWINADLHIHSEYSKDCVTPVEAILATAREIGLGALAIADHDEIEGALLARELSQGAGGDPFVIVAEEIKTAEGEVIGLFLEKRIPGLLSFDETLSLIKEQGGLVYVPHPFDALRTTPSYRALVDNLHRIDVIEIYNGKVALSSFNLSAERFAAKYNIVAGAGSDAHVLQGLGTAMIRMPRFDDPRSFMTALWEADIIARRRNLLYLQSLKLLQTTLDRVLPED
jgi:predicted metal-dependent phosphoesterase TrpH/glycosyltransferase involved in cell wall biosynthesis